MEMSVNTPKDDLKNMLRAAVFLVRRAIKDIVSSVSYICLIRNALVRNFHLSTSNRFSGREVSEVASIESFAVVLDSCCSSFSELQKRLDRIG